MTKASKSTMKDHGARGGVCASIVAYKEAFAISRRQWFHNVTHTHADRFLHVQDFILHVTAVKQVTVGGTWLVELGSKLSDRLKCPCRDHHAFRQSAIRRG